jgi:hypothetical protein
VRKTDPHQQQADGTEAAKRMSCEPRHTGLSRSGSITAGWTSTFSSAAVTTALRWELLARSQRWSISS